MTLSQRKIACGLNVSVGAVSTYLKKVAEAGLSWPLSEEMNDQKLETIRFPNQPGSMPQKKTKPDGADMHKKLKCKGVAKQLFWEEYKETQHYSDWVGTLKHSMRLTHNYGQA